MTGGKRRSRPSGNGSNASFATPDALAQLQSVVGLAQFANGYRQDPTIHDQLMASDAAMGVTILQQYLDAQARGFNDPTILHGSDLGFEEIGSAGAGDTIYLDGIAWRAVARGGDDIVYGGARDDTIFGGSGNDQLLGNGGNDTIVGDEGDDKIYGWDGNDVLAGGLGNDLLLGDAGNDRIDGGVGDDQLFGFTGDDIISGGIGNDKLSGEDGNDVLDGGAGGDAMTGGAGDDIYYVDDSGDRVMEVAGGGNDRVLTSVTFVLDPWQRDRDGVGVGSLGHHRDRFDGQ